jgi:hypothetical protein
MPDPAIPLGKLELTTEGGDNFGRLGMEGGENLSADACTVRIAHARGYTYVCLEAVMGAGRAGYLLDDKSESGWMPKLSSFRPHREPLVLFSSYMLLQ